MPHADQEQDFVARLITADPQTRSTLLQAATASGLSGRVSQRLLRTAEELGLIHYRSYGSHPPTCYATRGAGEGSAP